MTDETQAEDAKSEGSASGPSSDPDKDSTPPTAAASSEEGAREGTDDTSEGHRAAESDSAAATSGTSAKPAAMTAGQRLAAQKAAKAAAKAAKKGKTPATEAAVAGKLAQAGDWLKAQAKVVGIVVLGAILIAVGAYFWSMQRSAADRAAATLLKDAQDTANAEIRDPDAAAEDEANTPPRKTFATVTARATQAIKDFEKVIAQYPDTSAATWAKLGIGRAQLDLQKFADARKSFEAALAGADGDAFIAWRALEGIAFSYEGEQKLAEAVTRFTELGRLDNGAYRDVADYHLGRLYMAQNDRTRAKETLKKLVERLRNTDPMKTQEMPFVLAQAELRLMELDPSAVPRSPESGMDGMGGMGGMNIPGGGDITNEQLQELLRKMGQKASGSGN